MYEKNEKVNDLLFTGDFYLLTSSGTFSSAMLYAQYVKDNHVGTIIGEAPGNDPNGYGEVVYFALPNSKIFMSVSTKHFIRVDKDAGTYLVEPDIECSSNEAMDKLYEVPHLCKEGFLFSLSEYVALYTDFLQVQLILSCQPNNLISFISPRYTVNSPQNPQNIFRDDNLASFNKTLCQNWRNKL